MERETAQSPEHGSERQELVPERSEPILGSDFSYVGWLLLAVQFVFAVLICLATVTVIEVDNEVFAGLFIGFLFVQILLSSVWIALAPLSLVIRVVSSTAATLFFSLCMYRVALRDGGGGHDTAIGIVAPMLIQWVLFQTPLWFARSRGWKLSIPGQEVRDRRKDDFQFGIKHLLIWTTVVAIFMGIGNAFISGFNFEQMSGGAQTLEMGLMLTLGNGLIAVPIIWGCLAKHYLWIWILIAILVCTVVCVYEVVFHGWKNDFEFILVINVTQAALAIFAMLAVRKTGYRLQRLVG